MMGAVPEDTLFFSTNLSCTYRHICANVFHANVE
jgi:hypothetical protein